MGFNVKNLTALEVLFWGRGFFVMLVCVSAWVWWLTGMDRIVSGDMSEGCYLDGDRTKAATTVRLVNEGNLRDMQSPGDKRLPAADDAIPIVMGMDVTAGQQSYQDGQVGWYLPPTPQDPEGQLSGAKKGLPAGACALNFTNWPAGYSSGNRLWLVNCCGDYKPTPASDGTPVWTLYQAPAPPPDDTGPPDWTGNTNWPQAFPPAQWGWGQDFEGLPAQRLRSGIFGDVVVAVSVAMFILVLFVSAMLVWREGTMWAAEDTP